MIPNLIKTSFRFLFRNKLFTVVNVLGLAIGISCSFLIFLWIQDELSYDKHNEKFERICRLTSVTDNGNKNFKSVATPLPLLEHVMNTIPEIETGFSYRPFNDLILVEIQDRPDVFKKFYTESYSFADSGIFDMLSFDFIYGDPKGVFNEINSVLLTESISRKYFGDDNPVGKTISIFTQKVPLVVKGVIKDIPLNSHLKFDILLPFDLLKSLAPNLDMSWGHFYFNNYVLLKSPGNDNIVNTKLWSDATLNNIGNGRFRFSVQKMKDIHLNSEFDIDINNSSSSVNKDVSSFTIVALFILLIAIINFVNLSTAQSFKRTKEIGVRKVLGASRNGLIKQFLTESIILSLFALIFSFFIIKTALPSFNNFVGKNLVFYSDHYLSTLIYLPIIAIAVGLLSGLYPAFIISRYNTLIALKGILISGKRKAGFRKALSIFQFVLAIITIICALGVHRQLQFLSQKKLGYTKEQLLFLQLNGRMASAPQAFKNELLNTPFISEVSYSSDIPTNTIHLWGGTNWEGKATNEDLQMFYYTADYDFIKTMGIEIIDGRDFNLITDSVNYIINESAAKAMGMKNAVGKWIERGGPRGQIIGVIKNFHFKSLKENIGPLVLRIGNYYNYVLIKINNGSHKEALDLIQNRWKNYEPDYPAEIHFMETEIDKLYSAEQRLGILFAVFSILAIFISCMGLFGLVTFLGKVKQKEIVIRKIFGSKVINIVLLLLKEYFLLIVIATIIGGTIADKILVNWLRNFAYQMNLGIEIFLYSFMILCMIVFSTIMYHIYKLAIINPADSLKYE